MASDFTAPPDPGVVRTPETGFALTCRVGLELDAAATAPAGASPRTLAQPALAAWLAAALPDPAMIACRVAWTPAGGAEEGRTVTLADLGLAPIDALALLADPGGAGSGELDDRLRRHVVLTDAPRPDAPIAIAYMQAGPGQTSVFAASALARRLRGLTDTRPLAAGDVALPGAVAAVDHVVARARLAGSLAALVAPLTLPAGTVAELVGCAVTTTFGERFWIRPAGAGLDDDARRFTLFTSSVEGDARQPADTSDLLVPAARAVIDGPVLEEVLLLRDEMANMVWGVERTVPLPDGAGAPGREAALEAAAFHAGFAAAEPSPAADIRYRVMTGVPENWIPFVPARVPGAERQVRLQRAAMPRPGAPDPHARIRPLTALLRDGLEAPAHHFFLFEEELPREGARVVARFQRTRWLDGRVVVWLGARKLTGRGEGTSGLAFDRIESAKQNTGTSVG